MLLLLLAGTPVTAPPRLLNLAALLDFANVAYQAYQRAIERLAQATVEWQTLGQGNGQPEAIQAAAAAQAARHREVTDADKVYKAAAKKAKKASAAPSADDAQWEQRQRESNRDLGQSTCNPYSRSAAATQGAECGPAYTKSPWFLWMY